MKKLLIFTLVFAVAATMGVTSAFAGQGNGAPSGPHYNLNIIGVNHAKDADMTGNNGHRIFVMLGSNGNVKRCKILLSEGDFQVLDANGTDGTATFQLPNPDPNNDGYTDYSVFARAVGTPGGSATMTTCFYDTDADSGDGLSKEYCNTGGDVLTLTRTKGNKPHFQNVSRQLLYIYADIDNDGNIERVPLFSDPDDSYYWYYDNQGLKVAQLRFYMITTNVN